MDPKPGETPVPRPPPAPLRRIGRFRHGLAARTQEELRRRRSGSAEPGERALERRFREGYQRVARPG